MDLKNNVVTNWPYHAFFNSIILCHLDEGLEQSAVMLNEDLTGFPISTLNHRQEGWYYMASTYCIMNNTTLGNIPDVGNVENLTWTQRSNGVIP